MIKTVITRRADTGGGVEVGIYIKKVDYAEKFRAYPSKKNGRPRLLLSKTFSAQDEAEQYAEYLHGLSSKEITAQAV